MSAEEIMHLGRKIVTLEKCFNVREGATRKDDVLPWRMMHEKLVGSPSEDAINSFEKMNPLLDRYYEMHGWDLKTSCPTRETLDMLGLSEVANGLSLTHKMPRSM